MANLHGAITLFFEFRLQFNDPLHRLLLLDLAILAQVINLLADLNKLQGLGPMKQRIYQGTLPRAGHAVGKNYFVFLRDALVLLASIHHLKRPPEHLVQKLDVAGEV